VEEVAVFLTQVSLDSRGMQWIATADQDRIWPVDVPLRQVRGVYTSNTITVYQAYAPEIAQPALTAGRFVAPFKRSRMTWIKPSFLWMMYRCGWAEKSDQECVLAVEITRDGFEWALTHASLSHFDRDQHPDHATWTRLLNSSPARVQWDPERSLQLQPLPYRSLQLGLQGEAVERYIDEWTVTITDVTPLAKRIHNLLRAGQEQTAASLLPAERVYPLPDQIGTAIGATAQP
jgi:hypothetical protein